MKPSMGNRQSTSIHIYIHIYIHTYNIHKFMHTYIGESNKRAINS